MVNILTMKTTLVGLLVCLIFACSEELPETDIDNSQISQGVRVPKGPIDYIALGDSYTAGEGVTASERWPLQLADQLRASAISISDVRVVAESGWTTADLIQGITEAEIDKSYDLVSLLIGVNNQFRGFDVALFRKEFQELMEMSISLTDGRPGRVLVLSIPDYSVTEYVQVLGLDQTVIRNELTAYNEIIKEISEDFGAVFYDITSVSRMAAQYPELTAQDGLHPSAVMYEKWVQACYSTVIDQLTND